MSIQWTVGQVAEKVNSEGLGYTIASYLSADAIADPELAERWRAARTALQAVETYLDEHADADEQAAAPSPITGPVTVRYESLLCDTAPAIFTEAEADEHGYRKLRSPAGGDLRLNLNGGRFGSDPEIYIQGGFDGAELIGLLRELTPHTAGHIQQSVRFTCTAKKPPREHTVSFGRGQATLDYRHDLEVERAAPDARRRRPAAGAGNGRRRSA